MPNLKSIAYEVFSGNLLGTVYESPAGPISALDMIYGHRASVLRGSEFMRHKTGFTKESFERMLSESGVQHFSVQEVGFDLLVKIGKPKANAPQPTVAAEELEG